MPGLFGALTNDQSAAHIVYFGLFTLQHRGQVGAGIAVLNPDGKIETIRGKGLVSTVFRNLPESGVAAIGQVATARGFQPVASKDGAIAVACDGIFFAPTGGIRGLARTLPTHRPIEESLAQALRDHPGAYSLIALTSSGKMLGVRDPMGIKPLSIGEIEGGGYVITSETCALPFVRARELREVRPGEVVILDNGGVRSIQVLEPHERFCVFEFCYSGRPDSAWQGETHHTRRLRMGQLLAQNHPAEADIVVPVPRSSTSHAEGFASPLGANSPLEYALTTNPYIYRTLVDPAQRIRRGPWMKFQVIRQAVKGKRVVVVDDSIVGGRTGRTLNEMLKAAGAHKVHLRVASPPCKYPCIYGTNGGKRTQLIASNATVKQVRKRLGVDSLEYLEMDELIEAIGIPEGRLCTACFTGDYPIRPARRKTSP